MNSYNPNISNGLLQATNDAICLCECVFFEFWSGHGVVNSVLTHYITWLGLDTCR